MTYKEKRLLLMLAAIVVAHTNHPINEKELQKLIDDVLEER